MFRGSTLSGPCVLPITFTETETTVFDRLAFSKADIRASAANAHFVRFSVVGASCS